ncbi:unnamed protein product [Cochlearia groenlandica]
MGEYEAMFSDKWDFRRKDNNFDDSSSDDDPHSNLPHDLIAIHNPNLVLESNQIHDVGTTTILTSEQQPSKTRKKRIKKDDESKPEKPIQVRTRKPKPVSEQENKKKEEMDDDTDDVGLFMKTLLDDLTASRQSLMVWVKTELYGSDQTLVTQPPFKKRAVKKRMAKKKKVEEEKQSKPEENCPEMNNKPKDKSPEIAHNGGGDQVLELDCNAGPLDRFLKSGGSGLGRNYFHHHHQQQQQGQEVIVAQTEIENETVKNQKSIVLAIKAPNLSESQKKTREANTIKNRESKTQKDDSFVIPFTPNLSSTQSLYSTPLGNSWFPSSSSTTSRQLVIPSLASKNNNFQLRQPPAPSLVPQIHDISEFQTQGHVFGSSLFQNNNAYFSGFPGAFPSNLISSGYSFPTQVNHASTSQQRDNNINMYNGGMRMAGGVMRFAEESNVGNNSLSDFRNSFNTY